MGFPVGEEAIPLFRSLSFQAPATFDSAPVPGGKVWADVTERPENVQLEDQALSELSLSGPGTEESTDPSSTADLPSSWSQRSGLQRSKPVSRFLAMPHDMWDLSPPTREQTLAPCSGIEDSELLNYLGSPPD
ncbi:unnamed protein product [Rangifer tarandus platyrhynchus]|uniref:Uncharacterized protein n=2 Tax=Rangifer tarandus platyrhynchus TaxID=3082113 RepID=A0AC59ZNR2_RANTA|nr:unnamed protein product [Rangifer tarandus platyrhynchus]